MTVLVNQQWLDWRENAAPYKLPDAELELQPRTLQVSRIKELPDTRTLPWCSDVQPWIEVLVSHPLAPEYNCKAAALVARQPEMVQASICTTLP